jgi:membrane protein implicated in regulation of membrane protease activity
MTEAFAALEFWHWWILGLGLVIIEVIAPGFFLLWIGIAAGLTGLLALVVPTTPWEIQLIVFGVLSVACVIGWRAYLKRHPVKTDDPTLNRRGSQYVGRVFNLDEAIVNGRGAVRVGDTVWRAEGPDLPTGTKVKVTGVAGTVLQVEKVEG